MDITTILIPILIVVGIIVLAALAWMLVELVKIVKDARIALDESTKRLYPTLDHVEVLTDSLKPTVAKLDPRMDRITLTVDSVNLELMRVDTILENVSDISDSASSASDAVDSITHAPLKVVNSKVIVPTDEEVERNPRSRSAKLRIAEKVRNEK